MRCGCTPVMSRPSSLTVPVSGRKWPVSRLNRVDLPAPFGPITAMICCVAMVKLTSETARNPAKDLLTAATSSTAGPPRPGQQRAGAANHAAWRREQQHDKDDAQHKRPIFGVVGDLRA